MAPHIDGDRVRYLGPVGPERRSAVLGGALALLHLIGFDEPFGFSVVEAMACGHARWSPSGGARCPNSSTTATPVFLVDDVEEAAAAVPSGGPNSTGPPSGDRAVDRFGRDRMVDEYLAAYAKVLGRAA